MMEEVFQAGIVRVTNEIARTNLLTFDNDMSRGFMVIFYLISSSFLCAMQENRLIFTKALLSLVKKTMLNQSIIFFPFLLQCRSIVNTLLHIFFFSSRDITNSLSLFLVPKTYLFKGFT